MTDVALSYQDIVLTPQYSEIRSRKDVDTSVFFGGKTFNLPVVPSNMPAVIDIGLAKKLARSGYFYIMHRFKDEPWEILGQCQDRGIYVSVSIGVQDRAYYDLKDLRAVSPTAHIDFITIDIAHGHHKMMEETIEVCKMFFPDTFLIAGNVGTPEAVYDLKVWGADAVKVGVAPGLACTTYDKTGFMTPMFSTVMECSQVDIPIIADGGVRSDGDIAKALVAGATMVMIGSQLAGYHDSPGALLHTDEYTYYGSASKQNGNKNYVEGRKVMIPAHYNESVLDRLQTMKESLQSAASYAGRHDIDLRGTPWKALR